MTTVTVLPGDGIGPDIVDATIRILDKLDCGLEFEYALAGGEALNQGLDLVPEETLILGIFPPPEKLRSNRLNGKRYQRDHSSIEDCIGSTRHWEKKFHENLPSFRSEKCDSSEDALKIAREFLSMA